jgi:hypothetical protein
MARNPPAEVAMAVTAARAIAMFMVGRYHK